jgi:peptidoglycan/xylan/chitin deacetylase (PgdA/CDA1 family)
MYKIIKPYLSKINFFLNRSPKIEKVNNWRSYIPEPYKAVVTITADFELAWAWRYSKAVADSYKLALEKARLERDNVPKILKLCEMYDIPISWATVGHLFLESCTKENGKPHNNLNRLPHFENNFWKYNGRDWFEYDPCSNYKDAPEWYAPDLIEQILNSKVKHEIGCHTFSHIDCRDDICAPELFEAEINECKKEASKLGLELKSFVHPGHTIGNLNKLADLGFTSYQTDPGNVLCYPIKHINGLWELKRTYEFVYRKDWSIDYHVYRYKKIIDRAIINNSICNFWFHPSLNKRFLKHIMPEIFRYLNCVNNITMIRTVVDYLNFIDINFNHET